MGFMQGVEQIVVALDQFINTVPNIFRWFFPKIEMGYADETISARAWRRGRTSKKWAAFRVLIDALFFWQERHCKSAYESEIQRKQLPSDYRLRKNLAND